MSKRLFPHLPLHFFDHCRVGDTPKLAFVIAIQLDLDKRRHAFEGDGEHAVDALLRISVERKDRAQLGMTSEHELEPVFFGRVEGFLVGPDVAGGRILQFDEGEKTIAQLLLAGFELEPV